MRVVRMDRGRRGGRGGVRIAIVAALVLMAGSAGVLSNSAGRWEYYEGSLVKDIVVGDL